MGSVMISGWVYGVTHFPVCQILLQIVVTVVIKVSPPAWTSSAGMLSIPADFPFFRDFTAAFTSSRKMGQSSSSVVCGQFSTTGTPLGLWLYSSEQYSVHRLRIWCSSVRHFPDLSWIVVVIPSLMSGLSLFDKPSCCCSCSNCLQFYSIVLLSSYLLLFSYLVWSFCLLLCILLHLQDHIFSFSISFFCHRDLGCLLWPMVSLSDGVFQGSR